ncbi:putative periplasmic or secreted lipoprotein [Beggiatoa alba B18LD]|uniref:Putative periplasmic or secreted lipoprotein n=1 Tax=Beggiatoa alba B18LD TaxID=395493 RepID=I3CE05_9GAMM|nr:type II toxin-antitoxin system HicA family toxin [Beggiatoa alba]EIJ41848.1 putative periplasmic or secreted lipoprotein [Beggiatoa alba B18LD]
MPPVPALSALEVIRKFQRLGWVIRRQTGSHIMMNKVGHPALLVVPNHPEVARGTLRGLIRVAGLTVEEFIKA